MDIGGLDVRGRGLRLGLTLSLVLLAAGALAVGVWPRLWPWLAAVTAVAAALPPCLAALAGAQQRRAEAEQIARSALQGTAGLALPLVADMADLDARVHRAVLPIPYVSRDVEAQASEYLESGRPVLLVGSSMVGKTQMAVTLIKRIFGDRRIAVPDSMDALAALDGADLALRGSVVFLDDIDRLIGSGGITDGRLRALIAAGNVLVATIRAAEYDRSQPTSQLRPPEWDVLSVFDRVFVGRQLSIAEQSRLTVAVADQTIRDRDRQDGAGRICGRCRAHRGDSETRPVGQPGRLCARAGCGRLAAGRDERASSCVTAARARSSPPRRARSWPTFSTWVVRGCIAVGDKGGQSDGCDSAGR